MREAVAGNKPDANAEQLPKFEDIQMDVSKKLSDVKKQQLSAIKKAHDNAAEMENKELAAIDQSTPKGKQEYKKKADDIEANKVRRAKEYKDAELALDLAREAVFGEVKKAYDKAQGDRKKAADAFADSFTKTLMDRTRDERGKEADKEVVGMMSRSELSYSSKVSMPSWAKKEGGGLVNEGGPAWNFGQVKQATREMLMAIYMEEGPEAAKNKIDELQASAKKHGGKVDYFTWDEAMGNGGRGSFRYTLERGVCSPNRGSEITGKVMGYMYTADRLFTGDKGQKTFEKYEAYLRNFVEQGKGPGNNATMLTPRAWAAQNAPEYLMEPEKMIDQVINQIHLPEGLFDKIAAIKTMEQRKEAIRSLLTGVLAAEPDKTKWDVLMQNALRDVLTPDGKKPGEYTLNIDDLSKVDLAKITRGRELYGDAADTLDDSSKKYISGLILGADYSYAGQAVTIKGEKVDFTSFYKDYLGQKLAEEGGVMRAIDRADRKRLTALVEAGGKDASSDKKAQINAEYNKAVMDIVRAKIDTPAKVMETFKKRDEDEAKKAEAAKAAPGAAGVAPGVAPKAGGGLKAAPGAVEKPAGGAGEPVAKAKPAKDSAGGEVASGDKKGKAKKSPDAEKPALPPVPEGATVGGLPSFTIGEAGAVIPAAVEAAAVEMPKLSPAAKKIVTSALHDAYAAPRPEGGYSPTFAEDKINEGLAALPEGSVPAGKKVRANGFVIEMTPSDKGGYQAKIVQAEHDVKVRFHLSDVEEIPPKLKVAKKKTDSDSEPA